MDFDSMPEDAPVASNAAPAPATTPQPTGAPDFDSMVDDSARYSTPAQQAIAGVEGAAQGYLGPAATALETKVLGIKPENIKARAEQNPWTKGVSEAAGLGAGLLTGTGEGALVQGAEHVVPEGASTIARIGSTAAKGAIGNMVIQGGDEITKSMLSDPNTATENSFVATGENLGLAGLLGAALGGTVGSGVELWKAAKGTEAAKILNAVVTKAGGAEGAVSTPLGDAITTSGMSNIPPEVKAMLSDDPVLRNMGSALAQSDTTTSGKEFQKTIDSFYKEAGDSTARALGREPEAIAKAPEFSEDAAGKAVGTALAKEYQAKMTPLAEEFDDLKTKFKDAPLAQDTVVRGEYDPKNPYSDVRPQPVVPGTASKLADGLTKIATDEGWIGSGSDMEKEFQRVLKRLPEVKTLEGLTKLTSQVGEFTKSTLPFGQPTPLSRAGTLIKNVLRDGEDSLALKHLGTDSPDLVPRFTAAKQAYADLSKIKESVDYSLGSHGSTSGYAKGVQNMANQDGEAVWRRLNGKNDANILNVLSTHFPETAAAVREAHINQLAEHGADKAAQGHNINARATIDKLQKMTPELKQFVLPPEAMSRINAVEHLLNEFHDSTHNWSNTARTIDKLFSFLPGSVVGMGAMLLGHNPAVAFLLGGLTKAIGRDVPDAVRLSLLKFLGSDGAVEAGSFKRMVDAYAASVKGEQLTSRAVKNMFKAGAEILPQSLEPTERMRAKLDQSVQELQINPEAITNVADHHGQYLPEHGAAGARVASAAAQYLNSIRPTQSHQSPLDKKVPLSEAQKSQYNRQLDIAQQPLMILKHINNGTATPQDFTTLNTIYPNLGRQMASKVMLHASTAVDKGDIIPYQKRLGLSMLVGQALDSTMTPGAIMAAQPRPPVNQPPLPMAKPKRGTASLNKVSSRFMTSAQSAESDRAERT